MCILDIKMDSFVFELVCCICDTDLVMESENRNPNRGMDSTQMNTDFIHFTYLSSFRVSDSIITNVQGGQHKFDIML